MKLCKKCGIKKDLKEFYKNKAYPDQLHPICKPCTYVKQLPLRIEKWKQEGKKPCSMCKEEKDLGEYTALERGPLGLSYACKSCQAQDSLDRLPEEDKRRVIEHRWRAKMLSLGLCTSCGKEPIFEARSKKRCLGCLEARTASRKAKACLWSSAGLCNGCGGELEAGAILKCAACKEGLRRTERRKKRRLKLQVLELYGGHCACCGEENPWFLTIDHVNRDGAKERREKGKQVIRYDTYLKEKREDLQVLCFNCNCAREHNNGVCPHKIEDAEEFGFMEK